MILVCDRFIFCEMHTVVFKKYLYFFQSLSTGPSFYKRLPAWIDIVGAFVAFLNSSNSKTERLQVLSYCFYNVMRALDGALRYIR